MSVRWVPIGDVLQRRDDAVAVDPEAEYAMIGLFNRGRGLFERGVIRGHETKYARLSPLRRDDLIFSKLFAWEGSVGVVDREGWVSSEFPTYRIDKSQADVRYLAHVIGWQDFVDQLASSTSGLGQRRQRVAPVRFEAAKIPLPDLDMQRLIAARLNRYASASSAVARTEFPAAVFERSVWRSAVEARSVKIGSLVSRQERRHPIEPDRMYRMLGVRWYGEGLFVRETKPGRDIKASSVYEVRRGDLVYNRLFAWKGSFALAGADIATAYVSNEFPTFVVDQDRVIPEYVEAWLQSPDVVSLVESLSTRSTPTSRNRFKVERLLELEIPLPARETQALMGGTLARIRTARTLSRRRARLADALLPAARNEEFRKLLDR